MPFMKIASDFLVTWKMEQSYNSEDAGHILEHTCSC